LAGFLCPESRWFIALMSGTETMVTWVRRGPGGIAKKILQCLTGSCQALLQDLPCLHEEESNHSTSKGQQKTNYIQVLQR
jgi:hypothetical protein